VDGAAAVEGAAAGGAAAVDGVAALDGAAAAADGVAMVDGTVEAAVDWARLDVFDGGLVAGVGRLADTLVICIAARSYPQNGRVLMGLSADAWKPLADQPAFIVLIRY
jgi:hypothetical protein